MGKSRRSKDRGAGTYFDVRGSGKMISPVSRVTPKCRDGALLQVVYCFMFSIFAKVSC